GRPRGHAGTRPPSGADVVPNAAGLAGHVAGVRLQRARATDEPGHAIRQRAAGVRPAARDLTMKPLPISAFSLVSALGRGHAAHAQALLEGTCGLRPQPFETASLDAWLGVADSVDDERLPAALASYDCRNNRLAALALRDEGFDEQVRRAAASYGARRVG